MPETQIKILLLCADEQAANLDKRALRDAGYPRVSLMTSGIDAARLLADLDGQRHVRDPDIIICLNRLADMEGEQFCAIIRQHPRLLAFPILLILPNDDEAQQLRTLGCGASALLGRPYSVDTLKKQIAHLTRSVPKSRQLRDAALKADTSAFDDALATYGVLLKTERQPEDYFKVGMRCLEENRWNMAIAAFEHALREAQIKAEAELGVAAAYKGKGDMARFKAWLARASESFVRAKRWSRARTAYARLLQHDPAARNPFLAEAHRLIREEAYEEAAEALAQSIGLEKRKTGERLARVCLTANEPEEMFAALQSNLEAQSSKTNDYLTKEIREHLDEMIRQRKERQQQQAAERKWQLAQNLGLLSHQQKNCTEEAAEKNAQAADLDFKTVKKATAAKGSGKPVISAFGSARGSLPVELNDEGADGQDWAEGDGYEDDAAIEPFGSQNGAEKPGKTKLNELLSVVKLTWHLARKSRKNESRKA